jgi:O-antigen/teichoic acid export membrane protein
MSGVRLPLPPPGRLAAWLGPQGSARRVLAGNGAWSAGTFVAGAVVAFLLRPWLIEWLGTTSYGVWLIVSSLTGYFGLADLGVRPAVVHYIATNDARGDHAAVNRYVNTAFVAFAACGGVVLLASGAFALVLPSAFDLGGTSANAARLALLLAGADLALGLPWNAWSAVVVGKQRYDVLNRINLLVLALRTAAIVALLSQGGGIVALAAANLASTGLEMGLKARAAFRLEPRLRFAPGLAERRAARDLLGYGLMAVVVTLSLQLVWLTDPMVIGWLIAVPAVTTFSNGAVLPSYVRQFLAAWGRVLEPAAGALEARQDREALARILRGACRATLAVAAPMLVYLVVFGEAFLHRWLGPETAAASAEVMTILALGVAAPIASYPFVAVMYGTHRVRALAWISLAEGVVNLAASIALARPLGIAGVALGTAVPAFLVHAIWLPAAVLRDHGLRWASFAREVWARPLLVAALTGLPLAFLPLPAGRPGWPLLVGLAMLCAALYAAVWAALSRIGRRAPGGAGAAA